MGKKDFKQRLDEVVVFRQELAENSVDSANAATLIGKKLTLVGDAFFMGEITRQQCLTLYRTYNAALNAITNAHFMRNQITILPEEND